MYSMPSGCSTPRFLSWSLLILCLLRGSCCQLSPFTQTSTHFNSCCVMTAQGSKQARLGPAVAAIRTWCACKQYREQVDAYSDGVEQGKSSEAVGDGVHLWRSLSETCPVGLKVIYLRNHTRSLIHIVSDADFLFFFLILMQHCT